MENDTAFVSAEKEFNRIKKNDLAISFLERRKSIEIFLFSKGSIYNLFYLKQTVHEL